MRRFLFRLALALGKTVQELLRDLDCREFCEWIAFNQLEPLPQPWLQTGTLCAITKNVWGAKTQPEDFMPLPRKRQTRQEMVGVLRAFGG